MEPSWQRARRMPGGVGTPRRWASRSPPGRSIRRQPIRGERPYHDAGGSMSRGRHARTKLRLGWIPVLLTFAVVLTLLLAGAAFAGYRYDRATSSRILPGVSIAGVDVGGMTRAQATRALEPVARSILGRSIQVRAGAKDWAVTSGGLGTKVDVTGAVDRALSVQGSMGWTSRLFHRLLHRPLNRSIGLDVSYGGQEVWQFA